MKDKLLRWLDWVLVADFFLVLFSFLWLAIAVFGRTVSVPLGLNLWYALWQPVISPAIGILIAGTVVNGLAGWISKRLNSQQLN